jgi:hypothetical protein
MQKFQFRVKQVYGKDVMYPANVIAEIFVKLTNKKTLDQSVLVSATALGFEVERVF